MDDFVNEFTKETVEIAQTVATQPRHYNNLSEEKKNAGTDVLA